MKTARQWADKFCNRNVINVKGDEVQEFIKEIQEDALHDSLQLPSAFFGISKPQWQPIETAPQNEEDVLCFCHCKWLNHQHMVVAHRADPTYGDKPNTYTDGDGLYHPSHWMPLPEAP